MRAFSIDPPPCRRTAGRAAPTPAAAAAVLRAPAAIFRLLAAAVPRAPALAILRAPAAAVRPTPAAACFLAAAIAFLLATGADDLRAQWPGEIEGVVVDARSGEPVPGVRLTVGPDDPGASTDGTGGFRIRGLEPGPVELRARGGGYEEARVQVRVANGRVTRVRLALVPRLVELDEVRAEVRRGADGGAVLVLGSEEIRSSPGASVAQLLDRLPGLTARSRGPDGPETLSIRGSDGGQVLVLVDGVPLNDPVTGEADLSSVSPEALREIRVHRGAVSARFGPGALAGAVELRTAGAPRSGGAPGGEVYLRAGSLGEWGLGASAGGRVPLGSGGAAGTAGGEARSLGDGPDGEPSAAVPRTAGPPPSTERSLTWSLGLDARRTGGGFSYRNPLELGGGTATRGNAESRRLGARGRAELRVGGGVLAADASLEGMERGLPGRSFAPSDSAAQSLERGRAGVRWMGEGAGLDVGLGGYGTVHRTRARDPRPPIGPAYDVTGTVGEAGVGVEVERSSAAGLLRRLGGTLDLRAHRVRSDALEATGPVRRSLGSAMTHAESERLPLPLAPRLSLALRVDRVGDSTRPPAPARGGGDGSPSRDRPPSADAHFGQVGEGARNPVFHLSHDATLTAGHGLFRVRLAHRSAFAPPTAGDQHFREGVGVAPNPDLRPERVRGEVEAGMTLEGRVAGTRLSGELDLFRSHIRDRIVWAPDFRFVWSPRNADVHRRGLELRGEVHRPASALTLSGSYTHARVTYADRPGQIQLRYRPRNGAALELGWAPEGWRLRAGARYVGLRYPVPARQNALPGFWTFDASASRTWHVGSRTLETAVSVDRLTDNRDSFIFAFPEPGRTVRLEVRFR